MFSVTPCICGHPPTRAVAPSSYIVCMSRGGRGATSWYFRRGSKIFVTCCTKQTCFWKFRGGSNCPAPCCEPVHVYLHFVYRLYFVRAKFESKFFPPVWRNLGLIYARLVTSLGWGDGFFYDANQIRLMKHVTVKKFCEGVKDYIGAHWTSKHEECF